MDSRMRKVAIMMIGTGINALIGFLTIPLITRIVAPGEYGEFALLQTYISVMVTLSLLGLEQAYVRFYYSGDSIEYRSALTKKVSFLPITLSVIMASLFAFIVPKIVEATAMIQILSFICVIIAVIETFTRLTIRMEQDSLFYSLVLIVHRVVYGAVALILLYVFSFWNGYAVETLLFSTAFSLLIIVIVALIRKRHIWFRKCERATVSVSITKLIMYAAPFIFSSIANWIFNATDKLSLDYYSTTEQVGYYAAATQVVAIVTIFQTTFSTVWVPMAVEHYEKNPNDKLFFVKSNDIACLGMIVIGLGVVLIKDVFGWILGGDYAMATYIIPCLILHPVLFTISETTVYGINFYKKTYWHIVITVGACIVNIIGNMFLVPRLAGVGAAISTGLSYIIFFVLRTVISNVYYKVRFNYLKMGFSIFLLTTYCLYSSFCSISWINVLIFLVSFGVMLKLYSETISYVKSRAFDAYCSWRKNH